MLIFNTLSLCNWNCLLWVIEKLHNILWLSFPCPNLSENSHNYGQKLRLTLERYWNSCILPLPLAPNSNSPLPTPPPLKRIIGLYFPDLGAIQTLQQLPFLSAFSEYWLLLWLMVKFKKKKNLKYEVSHPHFSLFT